MKRSTFALSAALAALLCSTAAAQDLFPALVPYCANENDLTLTNGGDLIYIYANDPSLGPSVGTSLVPDFATNEYFWKTIEGKTIRACDGDLEVTGLECAVFDTDWQTVVAEPPGPGGNNAAFPDMVFGPVDPLGPNGKDLGNPGTFVPDQVNFYTLVTFGPGTPKNNIYITAPACPGPGQVNGFVFDIDLTFTVAGPCTGPGIVVPATGVDHLVWTTFIPGAGHTFSGGNTCANGLGDGSLPDLHSSNQGAVPADGETQYDWLDRVGVVDQSAFGGFGNAGVSGGADFVGEVADKRVQFREPIVIPVVASSKGHTGTALWTTSPGVGGLLGTEEGLAVSHYDCSEPVPNGLRGLAFRVYCAQGCDPPVSANAVDQATVWLSLVRPPVCANFKGAPWGLGPILFAFPLSNIIRTDNGNLSQLAQAGPTVFDDGTMTTFFIPLGNNILPALPANLEILLSAQGIWRDFPGPTVPLASTQIFTMTLHN